MIRFPITDGLNEQEGYYFLLEGLHPQGWCGARGQFLPASQRPHRRDRAPGVDDRCREGGAVFNRVTGPFWAGTHDSCARIVLILRGFAQGTPTLQRADEWEWDYGTFLHDRHPMQAAALLGLDRSPWADPVTEGDELFQNAGEKGDPPLTRRTHRAAGPTTGGGTGRWRTTVR
jgi:hypothetical protein